MKPDLGGSGLCSTLAPCIALKADLVMCGAELLSINPGSAVLWDVSFTEQVLVRAVLVCIFGPLLLAEFASAKSNHLGVDGGSGSSLPGLPGRLTKKRGQPNRPPCPS
mmetsp:Transcript_32524/g.52690  ORF Transcript_32524/g.52690 Transcript_32524/m.52690 type:complete len:108 (-) Transcript_32524:65-388(-)